MSVDKRARMALRAEAAEIVGEMSLEEKVGLMSGKVFLDELMRVTKSPDAERHYNSYPYPAGGNERLGVPEMKFCDGPRWAVCGQSTCFPAAMVGGVQRHNVIACVKHFAFNGMGNARFKADVSADARTEREASFPYGFGLSYTSFALSDPALSASAESLADSCTVGTRARGAGTRWSSSTPASRGRRPTGRPRPCSDSPGSAWIPASRGGRRSAVPWRSSSATTRTRGAA